MKTNPLVRALLSFVLIFSLTPITAFGETDSAGAASDASATSDTQNASESESGAARPDGNPAYVEGEVVVVYKENYTKGKIASCAENEELGTISSLSKSQEIIANDGEQVIATVELNDDVSVEQACEEMSKDARVEYVQPNFLYHMTEGQDLLEDPDNNGTSAEVTTEKDAELTGSKEASENAAENESESGETATGATAAEATAAEATAAEATAAEAIATADTATADTSASSVDATPLTTSVDDPYAAISTDNASSENQWWLYSVNAFDAWDLSKCNNSVTVAILDTGINFDHEDLKNNIDTEHAYDAEAGTHMTESRTDTALGHGTHVAGIVAAQANNALDFAGVSYNANILPINVFYYDTYYSGWYAKTTTLTKAYQYLKGLVNAKSLNDLHVINMSLGGYGSLDADDVALESEIADMNDLGVMTVCAGGNGDDYGNPLTSPSYPSDFDECVSVVALQSSDVRATWADYNQYKDISAPGVNIWSTWVGTGDAGKNATKRASGTSMASPLVAGCVALLFAAQPDISVEDAKQAMYSTATDLGDSGWDEKYGWGKINALAMLQSLRGAKVKSDMEELYVTQSTNLSAQLYTNQENDPAEGTTWTWSVDKPEVARIDAKTGTLTALSVGTVKVSATSDIDSSVKGSTNITINPISITDGISLTSVNNSIQISWNAAEAATGYDIYKSSGGTSAWEKLTSVSASQALTCTYFDSDVKAGMPYYYYIVPFGTLDGETYLGDATKTEVTMFKTTLMSYEGSNRYGTMSETVNMYSAERALENLEISTVILASGEKFPDALAASGLAGTQNCPVITTGENELNEESISVLSSINPRNVIVLGSKDSISEDVLEQVKDLLPSAGVRRIYGKNRIETAVKIYDEGRGSWGKTAVIANSSKFADALSVSPYLYASKSPLFLVDSDSATGLSASAIQRLRSGGFERIVVLGDTNSVPALIERQVLRACGITVERWAGSTRYETSQIISENAITEGVLDPSEIGVATGKKPWDAICAGPLMGMQENPLILMDEDSLQATEDDGILSKYKGNIARLAFFGSTNTIPESVRTSAALAAGL